MGMIYRHCFQSCFWWLEIQ